MIHTKSRLLALLTLVFVPFCEPKTSATDASSYTEFCQACSHDDMMFANFRRAPAYTEIVETVFYHQGQEYLEVLEQLAPHFWMHLHTFKTSDIVGNPVMYDYDRIGFIAPTTLRYIKVAFELEQLFGSLDNLSIVEIGGGYAGQCKIIMDLFNVKKYTIIDLPEALGVAKKFLDAHHITNVTLLTPDQLPDDASFDLVISNYAFSECYRDMQLYYIKNIMSKAHKGYCICNQVCHGPDYNTVSDMLQALTDHAIVWTIIDEKPLTYPGNYVLVWR